MRNLGELKKLEEKIDVVEEVAQILVWVYDLPRHLKVSEEVVEMVAKTRRRIVVCLGLLSIYIGDIQSKKIKLEDERTALRSKKAELYYRKGRNVEDRMDVIQREIEEYKKGGESLATTVEINILEARREDIRKEEKLSWERCMGFAVNHKAIKDVRYEHSRVEGELKRSERLFSTLINLLKVLDNDYNRVNIRLLKDIKDLEYLKNYQKKR